MSRQKERERDNARNRRDQDRRRHRVPDENEIPLVRVPKVPRMPVGTGEARAPGEHPLQEMLKEK